MKSTAAMPTRSTVSAASLRAQASEDREERCGSCGREGLGSKEPPAVKRDEGAVAGGGKAGSAAIGARGAETRSGFRERGSRAIACGLFLANRLSGHQVGDVVAVMVRPYRRTAEERLSGRPLAMLVASASIVMFLLVGLLSGRCASHWSYRTPDSLRSR
jgi:hypothetical protein